MNRLNNEGESIRFPPAALSPRKMIATREKPAPVATDANLVAKERALAVIRAWPRFDLGLLIGIALVMTAFAVTFFYFGANLDNLESYGYAGLFLINLVGAASIVLPSPAAASVVGGGAFLNSFLGLPAFFWVGLVAGLAEAIGELTGYAAGYGSRVMLETQPRYQRMRAWMDRRGAWVMFLLSVIPNPFFDIAGLVAGAARMPIRRFFFSVLAGRIIKDWYIAGLGALGITLLSRLG